MTLAVFHDFPGLENGLTKFHDFPGRVVTLSTLKGAQLPNFRPISFDMEADWSLASLFSTNMAISEAIGMEVGLGPGHTVLEGDPSPPKRAQPRPQFSAHVCCGQTAGWIKMPLGRGRRQPRRHCVRWGPSSPPMGTTSNFWPMSLVAKWLDGSRCNLVQT